LFPKQDQKEELDSNRKNKKKINSVSFRQQSIHDIPSILSISSAFSQVKEYLSSPYFQIFE